MNTATHLMSQLEGFRLVTIAFARASTAFHSLCGPSLVGCRIAGIVALELRKEIKIRHRAVRCSNQMCTYWMTFPSRCSSPGTMTGAPPASPIASSRRRAFLCTKPMSPEGSPPKLTTGAIVAHVTVSAARLGLLQSSHASGQRSTTMMKPSHLPSVLKMLVEPMLT